MNIVKKKKKKRVFTQHFYLWPENDVKSQDLRSKMMHGLNINWRITIILLLNSYLNTLILHKLNII